MTANRVQAVQERRRSNAAGPHGSAPTRASQLAAALDDWADEDVSDEAVDAVLHAIDPDQDVYDRTDDEVAEVRAVLTAGARHLIRTTTEEN